MSFKKLGLSDPILRSLRDLDHSEPSEIQKQAIPVVLAGKNLMAASQTGTGKTYTLQSCCVQYVSMP